MSKRKDVSSDARGSSDPRESRIASGSMEVDEEGESATKQTRTNRWHCDYCGKEIHEFTEYWAPWWEDWVLSISCLECNRKYEEEMEAYERATEEKTAKKIKMRAWIVTESFACALHSDIKYVRECRKWYAVFSN